jgi:hypothetical protein
MAATIGGTIKVNLVKVTDPNFPGVYTGDFSYDDTHLTKVRTESMTSEFQRWYPPRDLSVESIPNRKSKILKPPHLSVGSI